MGHRHCVGLLERGRPQAATFQPFGSGEHELCTEETTTRVSATDGKRFDPGACSARPHGHCSHCRTLKIETTTVRPKNGSCASGEVADDEKTWGPRLHAKGFGTLSASDPQRKLTREVKSKGTCKRCRWSRKVSMPNGHSDVWPTQEGAVDASFASQTSAAETPNAKRLLRRTCQGQWRLLSQSLTTREHRGMGLGSGSRG